MSSKFIVLACRRGFLFQPRVFPRVLRYGARRGPACTLGARFGPDWAPWRVATRFGPDWAPWRVDWAFKRNELNSGKNAQRVGVSSLRAKQDSENPQNGIDLFFALLEDLDLTQGSHQARKSAIFDAATVQPQTRFKFFPLWHP